MYFEKIKQDANSIVEAGFVLDNLVAEKSKLENSSSPSKDSEIAALEKKMNAVKSHIKKFLENMQINLKKQEALNE